ncbi:MAG: isochorismatase family protein [Treponema sp.]|jgi:nicotinamidase-related amidase|nr:isochorismatase family protein [Treponema sp.]
MKPALLIIDMQRVSYFGSAREFMDKAAECINRAISLFRNHDLPVIWIQHNNQKDVTPKTRAFKIIDKFKPKKTEKFIHKEYENSFNNTDLFEYLVSRGVDTPVISGFCAEYCVLGTYRAAKDLKLCPLLLQRGIAGDVRNHILFVESISDLVSLSALEKMLEGQ